MNEPIKNSLNWRYATKKFDSSKKIKAEDFEVLKEALRFAPSSYGIQPWKFLIIEDEEVRAKLKVAAYNQSQVSDASHFIVLCAKKDLFPTDIRRYMESISKTREIGMDKLNDFYNMILGSRSALSTEQVEQWNKRQVYIALGFLLNTAANMKIDACPMEGFNSEEFDKILGVSAEGYTSTVICALGYRAEDDAAAEYKKVRYPEKEVFEEI